MRRQIRFYRRKTILAELPEKQGLWEYIRTCEISDLHFIIQLVIANKNVVVAIRFPRSIRYFIISFERPLRYKLIMEFTSTAVTTFPLPALKTMSVLFQRDAYLLFALKNSRINYKWRFHCYTKVNCVYLWWNAK